MSLFSFSCGVPCKFMGSLVLCRKRSDPGSTIDSSKISPLTRHIIASNTTDDFPPQRQSFNEPNDVLDRDNLLRKKDEKPYPVNHGLHVKDQCRSVVARPLSFRTFTATTTTLPIAFAVSTTNTSATTATSATSTTSSLDQPARPTCSSTET